MGRLVSTTGMAHRPRGRRLRSLAFLPTLVTLGNLVCGFAAIHFGMRELYEFTAGLSPEHVRAFPEVFERMLPSYLSLGALLILVGMFLDAFDGLVARVTRSTTTFGGQLDSLADVITFGAAPATLMVAFMTRQLAGSSLAESIVPSPISDHPLGRLTWMAAALYVSFTAIRLARFNVEHAQADHDHRVFRGLPSPGAASILVAIIFFQDQNIYPAARNFIVYATPAITAAIAILMVSRIPYRRFYRMLGRQPFHQVTILLLIVAFFWVAPWKAPMLLILTLGYGLSGPIQYGLRLLRDRTRPAIATPVSASSQSRQTDKGHAI
jgi:CDP-diacylglycerol---serine O-phosphatidyltransferase